MKKLLLSFFALILCSTLWGATVTDVYNIGDTAVAKGWSKGTAYTPLYLGANITITANHLSTASVTNGIYSSGSVSGVTEHRWYIYKADIPGFTISIDNKYWIKSISVKNNPQNGGVLVEKESQNEVKANGTAFPVNAQAITCQVINGTSGNICARITQISVTYDEAPTGVTLNVPAAMNATVGNKFQIIATVAPSSTVFQAVKWTTNNADAVDVDQNGIIDVKGAGQATITATTVNGKTATCVIDAAATTDESFEESFGEYGTYDFTTSTKTKVLTYGLSWSLRSSQRNSSDMVGSNQGIELRKNTSANNYIAYTNAQQEGGVKRVSFNWRAVDGTKKVAFAVDSTKNSTTINPVKLPANGGFDQVQQYSRDVNFTQNMQFRILVTTSNTSDIVFGPITITPYLLYKTKTAEATGTYKNEDLINNTGATPTFTLENNDGEASIADDGTVTCLKEGEVTVKASWNDGKVYTTYTLTTHVKPVPDITFGNTTTDAFGSYTPAPTAEVGGVAIANPQWTYTSSNAAVATVNEGVFTITGAGTSTITATIVAGETYASTSATATLTVNAPTAGVWKEKYDSLGSTGDAYNKAAEPTYFYSKDKAYRWQVRNYQYNKADGNKVNGEDGIRIRTEQNDKNYIATGTPLEGGVKAVFFNWQMAGSGAKTSDFTVSVTETHLTDYSVPVQLAVTGGQYRSYVDKNVDYKANGMFRVKVNSDGKATVFGPMTIKPYLLYTRKDTAIKAMDYETAGFKYTNKDTINNTNGEGVITYAIEDADSKADIATINSETGEVTIVGEGTVKVIAKWKHDPENAPLDSVTTSYNLTIRLRSAGVKFEHKDTTVYLKDGGTYTQEVAKACESAVPVYSFEGEYGTCEINSATGVVTFTEPDTVVVKATVPQTLPYKGGSATYTLRINRSDIDPATLSFDQAGPLELNIDDAPFTNELTGVPETGCGDVKYSTNKPSVAVVNETTGEVTIKGAGDATITATVLQGTLYNQVTKTYQISVNGTSENKTITETFKKYERSGSGWATSVNPAAEREGDYFDWNVYLARHDSTEARDYLYGNAERATWLSNGGGYIESKEAVEGGIKRINFKWNKFQTGTKTVSFSVIVDGVEDKVSEELVTESGVGQRNPDVEYSHNFLSKKNSTLKFLNTGNTNMEIGEITITPYIYFPKRNDTIVAAEYIGKKGYAPLVTIDNTNSDGTITYSSDNPEVAEVAVNTGIVTVKNYSDTPVKITMTWTPSGQEETVTASYYLKIDDKQERQAEFAQEDITVARGETPDNDLTIYPVQGDVPASPAYTLESADTCVAKIVDNEVVTVAPGNTVITAHIDATSKCKDKDVSYTLHVTYQPTGQYWYETLKNIQGGAGDKATTEAVNGEDGIANKWKVTNVFHKDQINEKTGTRVRYSSSIATNEGVTLEGGIKEVLFSWCVYNNSFPTHFTVTAGTKPYEYRHGILASKDDVQPFAHDFNVKSNVALSISNAEQEDPQQSHIIIDSIKVIPYLYYTRKDTTLVASEMDGVYTYTNDKLINNTEDTETANFSYTVRAKDNAVSIADEHSGEITIIGAGTDTIQAAWDGVTTTYVVRVNLEDANLAFEKDSTVLLSAGTCQQVATKSTTADVKYELEGEHDGAEISETTGEVTFTKTGTFTILATVPVALPYNLDSARYTLTVNNKPTPTVVFDPKTVDMNAEAFTPEAKTIPSSGMGNASYESSNEEVAKIKEGKVTIVGEGTSTISVHYAEGTEWGEADADFLLTVTDVLYEDSIKESFAKDDNWQKACTTEIDVDGLFGWKTYLTRHRSSGESPDCLTSGEQATWFNNSGDAYLKSAVAVEGGIKRVAFNWKKETVTAPNVPSFTVKVDNEPLVVDATDRTGVDQRFNHNYFVKKNVALEIDNNTASLLRVGAIKITPYLYYETKKCTLDLKVKDNFKNEDLIDNRDDKATSSINYTIIAGNEGSIAEIAEDGTVTATAGGEITVQAQWSSNTSVTTTYILTILPTKTTINLMRNDGTEDKDVIENNIGAVMPEITLPTRTGYRFNAYFIDQACTAKRFTVTTLTYTGWVSNITYNKVNYTGEDRIWTYSGNDAVTLYADWKPERTITLDNQEATTAGTEEVVTAYCPNNNLVNLLDPIEVPTKTNHIFRGYYTSDNTKIIDANGAFIANVSGYTDIEKNYRKWIKDEDITLYAKWEKGIELKDNEDNTTKLSAATSETEGMKVYLVNRSFTADEYNTICLPFGISKDNLASAMGTTITSLDTMTSASLDDAEKNLSIEITPADSIIAGKPYLIKLGTAVSNPTFENVVIECSEGSSIGEGDVTFHGILSPKSVPADKSVLFVVSNDKLAWNATGAAKNMNGFRAYFHVDGIEPAKVTPRLVFRQPSTPTSIDDAQCTMQGVQKMIINNQLIIIRDSKMYNAQGAVIK